MFKFLKKLFSEEDEEVEKEGIKVENLEEWFKGKSKKVLGDLDARIKDIRARVKDEVIKTKDNLAILSTANLHNPKISVKETQFMEGNRKSYIMAVNSFLRGIDLERDDYSSLLEFCNDFNLRLDKFGKSTVRPFHILQEFFSHESRNIALNIKNLDGSIKELKSIIGNAKIHRITEIEDDASELNNKIKQKNQIDSLLRDKENVKEELVKNRDSIENEIEKTIKSKEYKQLNELKANKETLLASIREHNAKIVHAFSVMERPLKKLIRMVVEDSTLIERYIENPIGALVSDDGLKIVELLKKLESNINNLTLELKDKKREKVLETIKGLTEEFLREFVNKHNELNKKLGDMEKEITENVALKKENKMNYELSNIKDNLEKVNSEILGNEQELSKININEMKNNLGKEINELLKMDVVIS